jgi:hypothetical protein
MRALRSRAVLRPVALWSGVGLVLAAAWRGLTPLAGHYADGYERAVAGDVTLAVLELAVGIVTAIVGLVRSGPGSGTRFGVAVVGCGASSVLAWGVGRLLGAPVLTLAGVVLLAPLALSVVTVFASLVVMILARDPAGD